MDGEQIPQEPDSVTAEQIGSGYNTWLFVLLILIPGSVIGFFSYKLVKSLRDKERQKDEKKKLKQQRKEKEQSKKQKKK